jgi:hypothetical protein
MTDTPKTTESTGEPKAEVDELEKIMSEIEELQSELEETGTPTGEASGADLSNEDILKEIQANGLVDESNMEETLAELKSEEAGSSLLDEPSGETYSEKPMSNTGGNSGDNDGALTMTVTGNMTLKLKYEFEGQEVTISFADQALRVQMTDGTEFKVPVARMAQSNVKPFKKTG